MKEYNAGQLRTKVSVKGCSNKLLLKKFRDVGTVDRWGSGRVTQLHHTTGSFQSYSHLPKVNKYAFKKLVVLLIIFFFYSSERIVRISYNFIELKLIK